MVTFRCNHGIQQKQLDSQVAVAVAALTRRQDREKAEMEVLGAQDRLALSRKRVAALTAVCASLPLGDAVRQLSMTEYGCTLVNASDDVQKSKYRAVSNLDDYVFRPKTLEAVCLYEFTMSYFKRNVTVRQAPDSGTCTKNK
ncbi:hypothetical protein GQ600_24874 [Phytophthora cactorum]|nr:hypothetical protein GQ600_24874 [Phytophthora cactorum]